jgi:hypothetical protein
VGSNAFVDVYLGCFTPLVQRLFGEFRGKPNPTAVVRKIFERFAEKHELHGVEEIVHNWFFGDFKQDFKKLVGLAGSVSESEEDQDVPDDLEDQADVRILGESIDFVLEPRRAN